MKLIEKRVIDGRTKRIYDVPKTPVDRALALLPTPALAHFRTKLTAVDPLALVRSIGRTIGTTILEDVAHG